MVCLLNLYLLSLVYIFTVLLTRSVILSLGIIFSAFLNFGQPTETSWICYTFILYIWFIFCINKIISSDFLFSVSVITVCVGVYLIQQLTPLSSCPLAAGGYPLCDPSSNLSNLSCNCSCSALIIRLISPIKIWICWFETAYCGSSSWFWDMITASRVSLKNDNTHSCLLKFGF